MQPDFTTSMLKLSIKTAIKVLCLLFLFSGLFTQPPIKTEVKAETCQFNSNVLDAKCKCNRNQCRLSKTGAAPRFDDSGDNDEKYTSTNPIDASNFGSGEYDCFDANEVLGGESSDLVRQNKYKAIYSSLSDNAQEIPLNPDTNTDQSCSDSITYDQIQANLESRNHLQSYNLRYFPKEQLADQSKDPCYIFDFGLQLDETLTQYPKATDIVKDADKLGPTRLFDQYGITESSYAHCGLETFSFAVIGYRNDQGVTCRYAANFSPNTNDFTDTSTSTRYSFTKNCTLLAVDPGIGYGAICEAPAGSTPVPGPTKKLPFYQKFYVDEFNRLPNNHNIPEGAICKSVGGPNDGYAYWYYPEYFKLLGGESETNVCNPLFAKNDLFGRSVTGTKTFFGCLPNSVNGAAAFFVRLAVGLAGFITILVAIINLLKIIGASNNPDKITEARKKMVGAVMTFIFLLSSITILSILGLKVLDIGGLGGGLFRLFTGG